ncbi:MAG: YwiC-like family protein [Candidatus Rokubacteria bacterium]|nr:YwiC-like family protein [Candidatus Rokubacteria bacterium]
MPLPRFVRVYLLPAEHGGWFMLLGPFLAGAVAAGRARADLATLLALALAGFVWRQPLVVLVKALAGRRARAEQRPALRATAGVGVVVAALFGLLLARGHHSLVWLALAAAPVLAWQLGLVALRRERQLAIELIGAGALSLAAPAAYWVSLGTPAATGWWLWGASWLYSASAIAHVYLRLWQRRLPVPPPAGERWRRGAPALLATALALGAAAAGAALGLVPRAVPLPYALALAHVVAGVAWPAVGVRPVRIGLEQAGMALVVHVMLGAAFRASWPG